MTELCVEINLARAVLLGGRRMHRLMIVLTLGIDSVVVVDVMELGL